MSQEPDAGHFDRAPLSTNRKPSHPQNGHNYGHKSPGFRRISLDDSRTSKREKSLHDNDLQTLLDFCGPPQNVALERETVLGTAAFYGLDDGPARQAVEEVAAAVDGWQDAARRASISDADMT